MLDFYNMINKCSNPN